MDFVALFFPLILRLDQLGLGFKNIVSANEDPIFLNTNNTEDFPVLVLEHF